MEVTTKKRYFYIDLLKTIAIIMVIVLHTGCLKTNFISTPHFSRYISYAIRIICEGVPIFVMINGFLLLSKKEFNLKKHIIKIFKCTILLLIWCIIYIILNQISSSKSISFDIILKELLSLNASNKVIGVFWFLQYLILLYIIYPVLKVVHDNDKKVYNYIFIIIAIFSVGINLISLINNLLLEFFKFDTLTNIISFINRFSVLKNCEFLLFFMIGGYLSEYKEKLENVKLRKMLYIVGLLAWIISFIYAVAISKLSGKLLQASFNYHTIFIVLIDVALFTFLFKFESKNKWYEKIVEYIGKNSMGIYLIHKLIINVFKYYNYPASALWMSLEVVLTLFISLGIVLVLNRIPKVNGLLKI